MSTILTKGFETSKEELKRQGIDYFPHNPQFSKQYKKWMNKDEVWNRHLKQKEMQNLTNSEIN